MKQTSLFLAALFFAASANAQSLIPLCTSNYAGTQGVYLNPSSLADSRLRFQVSFGLGAFGFSRQPIPLSLVPFGSKLFSAGEPRGVSQADVRGPAIMARLGRKHTVALTTRYRAAYGLSGNYDLVRWINGANKTPPTGPQVLNVAADGYTEYAFSYGLSLLDVGVHHLKIGGTAKLLRGLQRFTLNSQATFAGGTATNVPYSGASISGTSVDFQAYPNTSFGNAITGPSPGRGVGYDVGMAYEFRPRQRFYRYHMDGKRRAAEEMSKYLFRLGVSLLDIGQIDYDQLITYAASGRGGTVQQADYKNKSPAQLQSQLISQFGLATGADARATSIMLPRATSVQLDVFLGRSWYGNVVYQTDMLLPITDGLSRGSVVAFGPRSEGPGGELAGTVYYYPTIQKVAIGLHVKAGIFIGGTDNLLGIFSDNGLAPHIYAGLAIPFNARRPKDRDKDEVSDKRDVCPDVAGILAFGGCPDTDGDKIQDKDDACPDVAGPIATNGCPDSDKDGVLDKDDACPNTVGLAKYKGCPDTDRDGVADNLDECPTIIGTSAMAGCPDTDKDGVRDNIDLCQNEAGLIELEGCPLRNRTVFSDSMSSTSSLLVKQLAGAFVHGPWLDASTLNTLKAQLAAQPTRVVAVEFSGRNEGQVRRIEQLFREELTRVGVPFQQFRWSMVVRERQETGFALRID